MRTREDILAELAELKANPPRSYSGSMYKTAKKHALLNELANIESDYNTLSDSNQFEHLKINITITTK
ncbi:hypothetical protein [Mammaliicoccus stepanovicii]|uniref:Uncharacterized protein n=1 Tax=Mammaliicoccus stepanovicii TaxID=643214 RepID=A0A240A3U0_9STAP|nr:hypothetical protein [Mammaliicoccus stepanovicii]PNZ71919.1 hypothetical protein CD111_11640 [Mammaliicoccus stepanovicii]GGI39447.1 hypothetical protein GCM10010896_03430 [Mammaliicoccus stepanovicii]SNV77949.1 Uncharacterised protein [Mammaliicoccus stepanovicii]